MGTKEQRTELLMHILKTEDCGDWQSAGGDYGWQLWHRSGAFCEVLTGHPLPQFHIQAMRGPAGDGVWVAEAFVIQEKLFAPALRLLLRNAPLREGQFARWYRGQTRVKWALQEMA